MATEIRNKFDEVIVKHSKEGKVQRLSDSESQKLFEVVNLEMREFRRDYQRRAKESHNAASTIVLTS